MVTAAPETLTTPLERVPDEDANRTHWVCLTQLAPPLIGLCDTLCPRQKRLPNGKLSCPECAELVPEHLATCRACQRRSNP